MIVLFIAVLMCLCIVGVVVAMLTAPGDHYDITEEPPLNPPSADEE